MFFLVSSCLADLSAEDTEEIKDKIEIGKELADILEHMEYKSGVNKFAKVLNTISQYGHPAISVVLGIASIVLQIISGPSPELQAILTGFNEMNDRFTALTNKVVKLHKEVKWTSELINLSDEENDILALVENFKLLQTVPNKEQWKTEIISQCQVKKGGAMVIYRAITSEKLVASSNILEAAMIYSGNDRVFLRTFTGQLLALLIQGFQMELVCLELQGQKENTEFLAQDYADKTAEATKKIAEMDELVKDRWSTQYEIDIDAISLQEKESSSQILGEKLMTFLNEKFFWRYWGVVVYEGWKGTHYDKHFYDKNDKYEDCECKVTQLLDHYNHNIFVASVPQVNSTHKSVEVDNTTLDEQCHYELNQMAPWAQRAVEGQYGACMRVGLIDSWEIYANATEGSNFDMKTVTVQCSSLILSSGRFNVVLFGDINTCVLQERKRGSTRKKWVIPVSVVITIISLWIIGSVVFYCFCYKNKK